MKLIFDFDYTLFRSNKLLEAVQNSYCRHGVAPDVFLSTYEASRMGLKDWKPEIQLALIKQESDVNIEACRKRFYEILRDCGRFLYEDATPVLEVLGEKHELFLVSYGEDSFQNSKLEGSGIRKFFKDVVVTSDITKVTPLSKILGALNCKALFVEDNPLALNETKKAFPELSTARINRGEGRYTNEPNTKAIDFVISSLRELEKIVKEFT